MNIKICERKIEDLKFEVYSDGKTTTFQKITITNTETDKQISRNIIAPIDYYTIVSAILFEETLTGFTEAIKSTWSIDVIKEIITELKKTDKKREDYDEKRFTTDNGSNENVCLVDNITGKEYESNFYDIVDLLNELSDENEDLKDEHHTMQELYDFRLMYNALLFNEWNKNRDDIEVYKSKRHDDNNIPFDDEDWFIVVAILPNGKQITNHYHIDYWDYFHIKEYPKVKDKFDGHTSGDVLDRLKELI